ncbi:hypothetical protein BD770DRAFT_318904 [Pilaira anomala]|nr:hypothetical protein BD770DRAFT_318904 [Pilaira anomala]
MPVVLSKLSPFFHNTLEFIISKKYWQHLIGLNKSSIKLINQKHILIASVFGTTCWIVKSLWRVFIVPTQLAHIPKVNTFDWFWSVARGESHDIRMKRLVMPLIEKHGLCLKYVMGKWILTVGDPVLLQTLLKDIEAYPKEPAVMSPVK